MFYKKIMSILVIIVMMLSLVSCKQSANPNNSSGSQTNKTEQTQSAGGNQSANSKSSAAKSDMYDSLDTSKSQFQKGYYDYEGTINNSIKIQMSLYPQGKDLTGTYFYEKVGQEIKLQGRAGQKDIILYEYDENGKNTGVFHGSMTTIDKIEGIWSDPQGKKKYSFTLLLKDTIDGAEYGKRYAGVTSKSDAEVESFAQQIQTLIANGDKEKISELIAYPVNVKVKGQIINITGRDDFIKNYDDIFYPDYKKAIEAAFSQYMFTNWQGIMFGDGSNNMWINEEKDASGNSKLMVTAINN